jgi:hypothetical protein
VSPVRPPVKVVGRRLDAEHYRLRDLLTRIAQPHVWSETGTPEADRLLAELGLADAPLPVLVEQDGTVHTGVAVETLVAAWRYDDAPKRSRYDVVIIGGGRPGSARRSRGFGRSLDDRPRARGSGRASLAYLGELGVPV